MGKIYLFGSYNAYNTPGEAARWIEEYYKQGHSFILGDNKGADCAFQKTLASIGADDNSTIYSMGVPKNNKFNINARIFDTYYSEETSVATICLRGKDENDIDESFTPFDISGIAKESDIVNTREWYEFRDRQLITDCNMAIATWSGEGKAVLHIIELLNIYNKPVYTFNI